MLPLDASLPHKAIQDSVFDQRGLNAIRSLGREQSPEAVRQVAQKFEAMFVQEMLKTMRAASDVFAEGSYFSSDTERFHRDMYDQQMALNLTNGRGIGLADQLYQQMMQAYGKHLGNTPAAVDGELNTSASQSNSQNPQAGVLPAAVQYQQWQQALVPAQPTESMAPAGADDELLNHYYLGISRPLPAAVTKPAYGISQVFAAGDKTPVSQSQRDFVALLRPHAEQAARELNINPDVLIAQAALETGWGKQVIHTRQGDNSFNLFNIKAGSQWQGDSVRVSTLEYQQGMPHYERASFRKYNSYAESFADYVRLIQNNPRYQPALAAGKNSPAYAEALQRAGYATDPDYASKIKRLLNSDPINTLADWGQSAQAFLLLAEQARQRLTE